MKALKHNKLKNTAVLFETLIIQYTSEIVKGVEKSKAASILKEHFASNSELVKELKLYKYFTEHESKSYQSADKLIEAVCQARSTLDKRKLASEKYNLVKAINESFGQSILSTRLNNYKTFASAYKVFEGDPKENPIDYQSSKEVLIESLLGSKKQQSKELTLSESVQEVSKESKEFKALTFKILVEKLNHKYRSLSDEQKTVLREYIYSISNSPKLKEFVDKEAEKIKLRIKKQEYQIEDSVTKIKLDEICNMTDLIKESPVVKDNHVISLLQYYEIIKELEQ